MSTLILCPNGHECDTVRGRRCPVCGAPLPVVASPTETITLPPSPYPPRATPALDTIAPTNNVADEPVNVLAGYVILGELGRGGMGVVYKARHTKLNRVVALKMILSGSHAGLDDLARFRTEGEAIARLHHPHIVQIHDIGEQNGRPFFSLEFCPGGSLEHKLNGVPMPPLEAATLVETLARAVHAAHQKGIIHRDLKPANVLFGEDGAPHHRLRSGTQARRGRPDAARFDHGYTVVHGAGTGRP